MKNTTVTYCHIMIINAFVFCRRRSSGSSSRKLIKMYRKTTPIHTISMISSALHFTVTTVTNCISIYHLILLIIKLFNVTVKNKPSKKAVAVTNCHRLLQTVTSLSHATVTRCNYYSNHITIWYQQHFVTVKRPGW